MISFPLIKKVMQHLNQLDPAQWCTCIERVLTPEIFNDHSRKEKIVYHSFGDLNCFPLTHFSFGKIIVPLAVTTIDREERAKATFAASVVSKDPIGGGIFRRRCLMRRSPFPVRLGSQSGVALRSPFSSLIGRRRDGLMKYEASEWSISRQRGIAIFHRDVCFQPERQRSGKGKAAVGR